MRTFFAGLLAVAAIGLDGPLRAAPVEIVTATYLGTSEDDDLQDATAAPDGTLLITGNTDGPGKVLPKELLAAVFGKETREPRCGGGFVAQLSADGKQLLRWAQFAPGVVILTTVRTDGRSVYLGGYATEELADLLKNRPGLIREYPLRRELKAIEEAKAAGKKDPIAGRPGLGRYGAPCVLRLSADLKTLEAGTYLEGWQQVWDKLRVYRMGKENVGNYREFFWQPTHIELLRSGDLIVCHDGGYFRLPTDRDRELARGDEKQLERYTFYDVPDHLSRLSPDLGKRAWKRAIFTPSTDPEVARKIKDGWPLPHYGNPRTHRLRLDRNENIILCGWSASATSKEPWWSPYLWQLEPAKGDVIRKVYDYDPMSGGGNRLGGNVSDTAVVTLALEDDGNILASLIADGGNTVMGWSPKGDRTKFEGTIRGTNFGVKLVHFWGQLHRVDGKTSAGLGGARVGPWGWVTDLASLPGKSVLAVGRWNGKFGWTSDAWAQDGPVENPNGFLRVYSPEWDLVFSTALPGVVPFVISPIGPDRWAIVGRAEQGAAPIKDALQPRSPGKSDGYLLIVKKK